MVWLSRLAATITTTTTLTLTSTTSLLLSIGRPTRALLSSQSTTVRPCSSSYHHHHHRHHYPRNLFSSSSFLLTAGGVLATITATSTTTHLAFSSSTTSSSISSSSSSNHCDGSNRLPFQNPTDSQKQIPTTTMMMATSSDQSSTVNKNGPTRMGFLNAADAAALDEELMSSPGFSLEQLMELAGLSVAEAVYQVLPPSSSTSTSTSSPQTKILLICGPGNNGGDGLVAARHLVLFGYQCTLVYPKPSKKEHFVNLVKQCQDVNVEILDEMPSNLNNEGGEGSLYDMIVDAIFGFSFHGTPREPFATVLEQMIGAQKHYNIPVISVDVPSGWNVDQGDVSGTGFVPDALVSLTTPKESSRTFQGRHFVGGRFLPPKIAEKYNINMPPYPGVSQVMDVTNLAEEQKGESQKQNEVDGWEAEYAAYLEEKRVSSADIKDTHSIASPMAKTNPKQINNDSSQEMTWEQGYAAYCAEKESKLAADDAQHILEMKEKLKT